MLISSQVNFKGSENMYNPIIFNNEVFKDIIIDDVLPIYLISNYGNVINKETGLWLSLQLTKDGYLRVSLKCKNGTKQYLVHRLVMMTFHPIENPENFEVNHLYGEKIDNYDNNLEWTTAKENVNHAFATGLNKNIRENHTNAKLSNSTVHKICKYLEQNKTVNEIINLIGFSKDQDIGREIRAIRERKAWKSISKDYTFTNVNNRDKFTQDQVEVICKMLEDGYGYKDILSSLGINTESLSNQELYNYCDIISNIRTGQHYSRISKKYNLINNDKKRYDQIMSIDDIRKICKYLELGLSAKEILSRFNISKEKNPNEYERYRHLISTIKTRKVFKDISKDYSF